MKYIIYKITNIINNKIYIGKHKTQNLNDNYFGSGSAIKNAIKKYSIENFEKEILFVFDNEIDALCKEKDLVTIEFVNDPNTYNLTLGGEGSWHHRIGVALTEEHRNKISIKFKNRIFSEEHKKKISNSLLGKPRSNSCKIKLSQSKTGKPRSKESKEKQAKSVSGEKNPFFGKTHSQESKTKIGNRIYTNKINVTINNIAFDSLKDATLYFKFGINYLTPIVKEMQNKNIYTMNKYNKFLKQYFLIQINDEEEKVDL